MGTTDHAEAIKGHKEANRAETCCTSAPSGRGGEFATTGSGLHPCHLPAKMPSPLRLPNNVMPGRGRIPRISWHLPAAISMRGFVFLRCQGVVVQPCNRRECSCRITVVAALLSSQFVIVLSTTMTLTITMPERHIKTKPFRLGSVYRVTQYTVTPLPGLRQHLSACAARPVSRKEIRAPANTMAPMATPWAIRRNQSVWDESVVKEWPHLCTATRKNINGQAHWMGSWSMCRK